MVQALGLEVAAIRKKGGGTKVALRGGDRVGEAEGSWIYRFVVAEDLQLRDDTPVQVTAGQEDVPGVLVSFRDGVLVVALEKDLGPKIAAARLSANDSFLIERLKERLEKVRSGEAQFCRSAADRAMGMAAPKTADADPDPAVTHDGRLNEDQVHAVRRSLGSDTTFVWGPPGTGKTTTVARIVEAHYRAGRSVLLVSNTNIAVDTALERVAERLKGEADFHLGLVIRQGPVAKEELRQRFGKQVILEEIAARLGEHFRLQKEEFLRKSASIETEERSLVAALRDLARLDHAQKALAARGQARDAVQANVAAREREASEHRARILQLRANLERARTMGAVRRFFSRLDPERLQRDAAAAERQARAAADAARALATDLPNLDAELHALRQEVDPLVRKTRSYPPEPQIRSRLAALRSRLGQIRERTSEIDGELAALEQEILARCRILATTVYQTYLGKNTALQFDAVVIDEASMLMLPLVFYAAGLATESVTIAGDFRQLPPIVISDDPLSVEWLKCDAFEKAGIPQRLERHQPTPQLVALGTQYRMREPICAVINELFYTEHPLRSDPSTGRGGDDFPFGSAPLLYVDTTPFHPWAALQAGTYSRYNLFHALLVRNIILHLAEVGLLPPEGKPNNVVGAISPYASQARLIQSLLDERLGQERAAGIAATVHRFQGNERRAVLLDLTDSLGVRLGRFLRATRREEDGARLLNVAASRAKDHVVLVGSFEYLLVKAPHDGFMRRLVDHFLEHGEALQLDTLLALAERDWVDGLHRVSPANFVLPDGAAGRFNEGTFYPAFATDLARTRKSIVILSPFATGQGTSRWVDALRAAVGRGVRVRVLTRPADEYDGGETGEVVNELVRGVRAIGVNVDSRARMHEKIAILDGRILWHGSLNILSHRDTHESMLRIESRAACQELARSLSPPGGPREDDAPPLETVGNPECPNCRGATVWKEGRNGIYFQCEDPGCGCTVDPRRRPAQKASGTGRRRVAPHAQRRTNPPAKTGAGQLCPQPACDGRLAERDGRFGPFLGCTNYPRCRYTENLE